MHRQLKIFASKTLLRGTTQVKDKLDAHDITKGFDALSKNIRDQGLGTLTIVVSGGACSVLYLQNRATTRGVDYLADGVEVMEHIAAARNAASASLPGFSSLWINSAMIAHVLNYAGCENLFEKSVRRNVVLYASPFLHVYAADWKYQFTGKVKRTFDQFEITLPNNQHIFLANDEHFNDALHILRQLLDHNKGSPIRLDEIRKWYYNGYFITKHQAEIVNLFYKHVFSVVQAPIY